MYVENLKSPRSGESVKNQFAIYCRDNKGNNVICFQSYRTLVAVKDVKTSVVKVHSHYAHYSHTTSKYLHVFLTDYCYGGKVIEVEDLDV